MAGTFGRRDGWMAIRRVLGYLAVTLIASQALAQPVLVLYPVVREPYARVYRDTVNGIGQIYTTATAQVVPVESGAKLSRDLLAGGEVRVAVALGNHAARTLHALDPAFPVISTASADIPFRQRRQLVYYPDPDMLLEQVRRFDSSIRRVKLVSASETLSYQASVQQAYQASVQQALASAGVELEVCDAASLKQAADCYRELLADTRSGDALWLLHGGRLLEPSLLTYILDVAWRRQLPVFSSNPSHAGRGALFALYPDNEAAGRQLGHLVEECLQGCGHAPPVSYLREMKVVLNERTSRHLGLGIAPEARLGVDLL